MLFFDDDPYNIQDFLWWSRRSSSSWLGAFAFEVFPGQQRWIKMVVSTILQGQSLSQSDQCCSNHGFLCPGPYSGPFLSMWGKLWDSGQFRMTSQYKSYLRFTRNTAHVIAVPTKWAASISHNQTFCHENMTLLSAVVFLEQTQNSGRSVELGIRSHVLLASAADSPGKGHLWTDTHIYIYNHIYIHTY